MAGTNPDLLIRVAANIADLKKNLAQGIDQIEVTTAGMQKLAQSLEGSKLFQRANNIVAAVNDIGGAAKLTTAEQTRLNRTLDAAIEKYAALGKAAPTAMRDLSTELQRLQVQSDALTSSVEKSGNGLVALFSTYAGPLVLGGLTTGLVAMSKSVLDLGGHIADLSAGTGLTYGELQRLGYAGDQAGVSMDAIAKAVQDVQHRLADGDTGAVAAVHALGLNLDTLRQASPGAMFDQIAMAVSGMSDPLARTNVAMELMGRSGAEMLPLLTQNLQTLEGSFQGMSDHAVDALDNVGDAWSRLVNAAKAAVGQAVGTTVSASQGNVTDLLRLVLANPMALQGAPPDLAAMLNGLDAQDAATRLAIPGTSLFGTQATSLVNPQARISGYLNHFDADRAKAATAATQAAAQAAQEHAAAIKAEADEVIRLNAALVNEVTRMQAMVTHSFVTTQALEGFASSMKQMGQALSLPQYGDSISVAEHGLSTLMQKNSSADALSNAVKFMPRVSLPPPPKASVDEWDSALKSVGSEFQQLSQIADGSMADITRAIGSAVSATGMLVDSWQQMHKEGATAADKIAGSTQAIGAGAQIASQIGGTKGGAIGGALAGAEIGSIIPGIGTAFGAAIGAGVGAMVSAFASKGRDLVQQFADTEGGFDALHQKLLAIGDSGEQLWKTLTQGVGSNNPKQAQAAIDQVNAALTQFNQTQLAVQDKFSSLLDAVNEFGGKAPKQLQPMIEQLLQMQGLTEEQQQLLKDMLGDPSMDALQDAADTLGVTFDHMGQQFKAAQIDKTAFTYQHALDTLRDSGADMNGVLMDSKDKINELVDQAMEAGAALPDTMKPYIQKLIDMGQLVAPDGTLVTNIDQLSFADIPDSSLDAIKTILGQIRDLLKKDIPEAAGYAQSALDAVHMPADVSPGPNYVREGGQWVYYPTPEAADAARISQNRNANAGQMPHLADGGFVMRPTVALIGESGPEAVVPLSRGGQLVGAGVTIVNHVYPSRGMSERELAQMVAKRIPDELRKAGY